MKDVTPRLTVECFNGEIKVVHAAKPFSSHPGDYYLMIVLHSGNSERCPFVVHTLNLENGGFNNGRYCTSFDEALTVFNQCN